MSLTFEECKTYHYKMWDWLANNPGKTKGHWPGWDFEPRDITVVQTFNHECFACHWAMKIRASRRGDKCDYCPIEWMDENCTSSWSEYQEWVLASKYEDYAKTKELAILIRDKEWTDKSIVPE